ncbi:YitT family protein [Lonepinella sp. MS14437]|uniref:membrane protein YczE n=1 Tax=unclassified Lonepinella TaxID=2642006 RepID=UPI0036DDEEF6
MKLKSTTLPSTIWTAKHIWSLETKSLFVLLPTLVIMGIGEGLILLSNLGSAPWTVLSQGIALQGSFSVGWASFIISGIVMLLWIPLKVRLGIGTLLNLVVIAILLGITVASLSVQTNLIWQIGYFLVGMLLLGIGTAFYLTCHLGAGPRDGLMVGICHKFHWKIGKVRTIMEVTACALGYWLGGTVGVGTLIYALAVGWVIQGTLSLFRHG